MFHVKQSAGMLDLKLGPGEYEALAPCLLEETIMRARRRGRNRPSPQGPASVDSGPSSISAGQGSVRVVEASNGDALPDEDSGTLDTLVVTGSDTHSSEMSSDRAVATPSGAEVSTSAGAPEHPVSAPISGESDVLPESSLKVDGGPDQPERTLIHPKDELVVTEESSFKETEKLPAEVEAKEAPSVTGRQSQAASGNPLPRVLAVANQKGGVGKTTTSVNLGAALAELGFRVLVIDLDPQGNATTGLGIDARNFELSMYDVLMRDCSLEDCVEPTSMKNLFVAPATIALAGAEIELVPAFSRELKLKRAIESVIDDFDYVLIDCPPSLGLITVNALAAASEVLVPIQCEYYALEGLSQLMRNVHLVASNLNPRLDISTIVLTMYDARTKLADQVATEVREHFGSKVCRSVIPRTVRLSEAPSFGQPITAFDPASRGAIAYRELAKEVSGGTS